MLQRADVRLFVLFLQVQDKRELEAAHDEGALDDEEAQVKLCICTINKIYYFLLSTVSQIDIFSGLLRSVSSQFILKVF
jgi:hypothetical protein